MNAREAAEIARDFRNKKAEQIIKQRILDSIKASAQEGKFKTEFTVFYAESSDDKDDEIIQYMPEIDKILVNEPYYYQVAYERNTHNDALVITIAFPEG